MGISWQHDRCARLGGLLAALRPQQRAAVATPAPPTTDHAAKLAEYDEQGFTVYRDVLDTGLVHEAGE
jgi:hypothetical protein